MNYRFTAGAQEDLRTAVVYYEDRREGLGDEFSIEVEVAIAQVLEAPARWRAVAPGVRKYRLDRFPYALIYRAVTADLIEVVAVFDLRHRPGSWKAGRV